MEKGADLGFDVYDERFQNPLAAADYLESLRWPDGPTCPHCGVVDKKHYRLKSETRKLWKCRACRKQFTVTIGSIFEGSHIPLNKWLLAFYLLCSSKKGMSAHQLHRMLGVTYKSAWFMAHRIRYAMSQPAFQKRLQGVVEVDETYIGGKPRRSNVRQYGPLDPTKPDKRRTGRGTDKTPVVALVERGGIARAERVANVTGRELKGAIRRHVDPGATLMTDAYSAYRGLDKEFERHEIINHLDEYVRGEVHTNTAESFFAILKRGIDGVYHHVSEAHLGRYLDEFTFRYNNRVATGVNDAERTRRALLGAEGKRLRYAR